MCEVTETKTPDKPDVPAEETLDPNEYFAHGVSSALNSIQGVMEELEKMGGLYSDLRYLAEKKELQRQVAKLLIEARANDKATKFPLEVRYDLSLERLITIANFDQVDYEEIPKYKFASPDEGRANLVAMLVGFLQPATIEEVQKEINGRTDGAKPANAKELVAFAAKFPEAQLSRTIFALGSVVVSKDKSVVLCATSESLVGEDSQENKKRVLCAETVVGQFGPSDVFLLVKPDQEKTEEG